MVHPATKRAVRAAITALDTPLDIGFVFPPRPGEGRGRGVWTGKNLDPCAVIAMLPRAAAANARGAHIYMRLGPLAREHHPGVIMLDDLTAETAGQLSADGLEPSLVVETSPRNFQAWIRLIGEGTVPYHTVHSILRALAVKYGADPRAVSPVQPGRVPGFTNRKQKYRQANGKFPFVRLIAAHPGLIASAGPDLVVKALHQASNPAQAGRARGAAPETPRDAARSDAHLSNDIIIILEALLHEQRARIEREVVEGSRSLKAASQSEIDFAVARVALENGVEPGDIVAWFSRARPDRLRVVVQSGQSVCGPINDIR